MKKFINDSNIEIGIDEAGRGSLIGRVYAGAVIWGSDTEDNIMIKDSKKLSRKKRHIALEWIKSNVKAWGVGYADSNEIDKYNILEATKIAMDRAILNLKEKVEENNYELIIDGSGWGNKFNNYKVTSIVNGDNQYLSIAAASIIAKEYHDEHIKELCNEHIDYNEKYNLEKNMGYGTKAHLEGIQKYGITEYHRKSYKCCV